MRKVNDFLYEEESYIIRAACFGVWDKLGSAFKKSAIDKALSLEMIKISLKESCLMQDEYLKVRSCKIIGHEYYCD
jgi:hypothetical protein